MRKVILLIFVSLVQAHVMLGSLVPDTLLINYIGQENGLAQLNVQQIVQDDLDYLWFSTEDGLHRFNGTQFKIFSDDRSDSLSIPDDHDRGLLIIDDTLWVASNSKGIFAMDLKTEKFFKPYEALANAISYKVFKMDEKHLLFSLSNVFYVLNRSSKNLMKLELPHDEKENYVKGIYQLTENEFLLATLSSGILRFDISNQRLSSEVTFGDFSHNVIIEINDELYVGTDSGLYSFENSNELLKNLVVINCVYKYQDQLLLGTKDGLIAFDPVLKTFSKRIFKDPKGRVFNPVEIETIYGDQTGNLWFGTAGEGLLHYNEYQKKFNTLEFSIEGYSKDTKLSSFQILPDKDSTLWLGTSSGIIKYNHLTEIASSYDQFSESLIYTLVRDNQGNIWCGGFDNTGLLTYNSKLDRFEKAPVKNMPNNKTVIQVTPLSDERLMVATWSSGMFIYDIQDQVMTEFLVDGKQLNRARISLIDSKKNLWIGSDEGVYCINDLGRGNTIYLHEDGPDSMQINNNRIFAINEDSKGIIWLGTSTGLTKIDTYNWNTERYFRQEGFPNDFIYGILIDRKDRVWMSTNKGISVFNPIENSFMSFSSDDGLQNDEFNGKAAYLDKHGNFYFGGVDGINIFIPDSIKLNPYFPKVHLESVDLFNAPLSANSLYTDQYSFKSDENVLTFQFAATSYLNPEKVNYKYMMEGFDKSWRPATKNQSITYTNLPPGDYTFQIKSTNDMGIWGGESRAVSITVIPPWYETWWFRISAFLMVASIIAAYVFYKYYSLKRNKLILEQLVNERTTELKEALSVSHERQESIKFLMRELKHRVKNNLQIISSLLSLQAVQIKDKKATESLHTAKNRISNISFLENIMDSENEHIMVDKFTKVICENVMRLISIDDIHAFEIDYDLQEAKVSNFNITIYGLIINELMTNTSKYAFDEQKEGNQLLVKCSVEGGILELIIADNGKGYDFDKVKSTSLGLDLVNDMVRQLNGKIFIENNKGTKNIIRIPVEHE